MSDAMVLRTQALKRCLLAMVAPATPLSQQDIDALTPQDWEDILSMARQHRLLPLMQWVCGPAHRQLILPAAVAGELSSAHKAAVMRSLAVQRELVKVARVLRQAGIPFRMMKGAYLAWHAYPQPALRPMRDIDVLVPKERVQEAFDLLLSQGLERNPNYQWDPHDAAEVCHHLPPIRTVGTHVTVEVHQDVLHDAPGGADLAEDEGYWQRSCPMSLAGETVHYEDPTDLLLHLIVHAVADHRLNNGPLFAADVAMLLQTGLVDGARFQQLVQRHQMQAAVDLALALVQRHWGIPGPHGAAQAPSPALLQAAEVLMLTDMDKRQDVAFQGQMAASQSVGEIGGRAWSKLVPARPHLAISESIARIPYIWWLGYFTRLARFAFTRVPQLWRHRQSSRFQSEVQSMQQLLSYLEAGRR